MIHCKTCNVFIKRKSDYPRHLETARHIKNTRAIASAVETHGVEPVFDTDANAKAAAEPPSLPVPEDTIDAIVNLYRFPPEIYESMTQKGIVKTAAEILLQRFAYENAPFFVKDDTFYLYFRGNWVLEKLTDIEAQINNDVECDGEKFIILEIIEMFIENMIVQLRRHPELHKYPMIEREITNGYRMINQMRIIKKLASPPPPQMT